MTRATDELLAEYPKHVELHDGTTIVLRPVEPRDYGGLQEFLASLPRADRISLRRDEAEPAVFRPWSEPPAGARRLRIVALAGDRIVGYALLDGEQEEWSSHVAEIRVIVDDRFKRRSIGTLLARELIDQARRRNLEKLVAMTMDTQIPARRMLERIGFGLEAELKGQAKDLDGNKHCLLVLTCSLDDAWQKMADLMEDFAPSAG